MSEEIYSFFYDLHKDDSYYESFDEEDIQKLTKKEYTESNVIRNINNALKYRNMTKKELAKKLKVAPSTITMWLNGKNKMSLEDFLKIASILQLPLTYFISNENKTRKQHQTNDFKNVYGSLEYIGWKFDYYYQIVKAKKPDIRQAITHIYKEFNKLENRGKVNKKDRVHD